MALRQERCSQRREWLRDARPQRAAAGSAEFHPVVGNAEVSYAEASGRHLI
jgi:hypothetical protein